MKYLVTGCAGFIGSNFVDRLLLDKNNIVIGVDNFSTGRLEFLSNALNSSNFTIVKADLLALDFTDSRFSNIDCVVHFAANADVRFGLDHPSRDLEQNVICTHKILEFMRLSNVRNIIFSSTGSVYGEASIIPTPESCPFPVQTSLYGASKLSAEALISAYSVGFGISAWIFRFVSVLGERYTHGHIYDFYKQLRINPDNLTVLGDGTQKKSYIYIQDCLDAIFVAYNNSKKNLNIFNLGVNNYCNVKDSIGWICNQLEITPKILYGTSKRGWIGDNPFILLDTSKINNLGWTPKVSIQEGVLKTLRYLKSNEWLFTGK